MTECTVMIIMIVMMVMVIMIMMTEMWKDFTSGFFVRLPAVPQMVIESDFSPINQ